MSKIQWEYDLVERPFCEQLRAMGWEWLEGDTDVPELTERESFREVLLQGRLAAALRRLNLRDGQPWLDEGRIARAIRDLTQAPLGAHRLMEVNQAATELLLKGFRWGSCGRNRMLFFNWRLLQLPVRLVDYVIVHELQHLAQPHHGPEFWSALDRALPDRRAREDELRVAACDAYWCHREMAP